MASRGHGERERIVPTHYTALHHGTGRSLSLDLAVSDVQSPPISALACTLLLGAGASVRRGGGGGWRGNYHGQKSLLEEGDTVGVGLFFFFSSPSFSPWRCIYLYVYSPPPPFFSLLLHRCEVILRR